MLHQEQKTLCEVQAVLIFLFLAPICFVQRLLRAVNVGNLEIQLGVVAKKAGAAERIGSASARYETYPKACTWTATEHAVSSGLFYTEGPEKALIGSTTVRCSVPPSMFCLKKTVSANHGCLGQQGI